LEDDDLKVYISCSLDAKTDHKQLINKLFDAFELAQDCGNEETMVVMKLGVPSKKHLFSSVEIVEHIAIGRLVSHGLEKEGLVEGHHQNEAGNKTIPGHSRRNWISVVLTDTINQQTLEERFVDNPACGKIFKKYGFSGFPLLKGNLAEDDSLNETFMLCFAPQFVDQRARAYSVGVIQLRDVMVIPKP
jgi:hypothetical protein